MENQDKSSSNVGPFSYTKRFPIFRLTILFKLKQIVGLSACCLTSREKRLKAAADVGEARLLRALDMRSFLTQQ